MGKKNNKYPTKKVEVPAEVKLPPATQPSTIAATSSQSAPFSSTATNKPLCASDLVPLSAATIAEATKRFQGTRGKPCKLEVNFLPMNIASLITHAYHYDVSMTPTRPRKFLPRALKELFARNFKDSPYAFDNFANESEDKMTIRTNVYVSKQLKLGTDELQDQIAIDKRNFLVTIKLAAKIDMRSLQNSQAEGHQQALQCFDITMRSVFRPILEKGDAVMVGKRLYFSNEPMQLNARNSNSFGGKFVIFPGIFQSATICRKGIYMNSDVIYKAFCEDKTLLEYARLSLRLRDTPKNLDDSQVQKLREELKGLTIECQILGNNGEVTKVIAHKFTNLVASNKTFELKNENKPPITISVIEYYRRHKDYKVKFPNMPLVHVGSSEKTMYFPAELCLVPRHAVQCDIADETATSCKDRKKNIIKVNEMVKYGQSKEIQSFGLDLSGDFSRNFEKVQGRIIDPPRLEYRDGKKTCVNVKAGGTWYSDKFLTSPVKSLKFAILSTCEQRTDNLIDFGNAIAKNARNLGMDVVFSPNNVFECAIGKIHSKLQELKKNGYELVFVIFIDADGNYGKVKRAAELKSSGVDIMTQCLKQATFSRMMRDESGRQLNQIVSNLLLKDNAKMNGTNYSIDDNAFKAHKGIMFIGADVNHPGSSAKPSVAGIVASYDLYGMRYDGLAKYQAAREEMIHGFDEEIKIFLKRYFSENKKLPEKIMYYRDGVSESQFSKVLEVEWRAIMKGLSEVYKLKPLPKLTFTCVQKRHHTRFFPLDPNQVQGNNANVMPGTCVDSVIVHPTQYQFYLASHGAIKGTVRPAKYCVLKDESGMSTDDLQAITHALCHAFVRCTRAVSYPAPTYYSHLLAKRAEAYLDENIDLSNLKTLNEKLQVSDKFVENNPMYFT